MASQCQAGRVPWGQKVPLPARMGARTTAVRAVGAWVQPAHAESNRYLDAVMSAQIEEKRMDTRQDEKEAKLEKFQAEVRQRVQKLQKLKKQQQLDQSSKAVEAERNIVRQSAFASEICTPRKNRCTVRQDKDLSIKQRIHVNIEDTGGRSDDNQGFAMSKEKVHIYTKQAKGKLTSRQVITGGFQQDKLPGGMWKTGATRDNPDSRGVVDLDVEDLEEEDVEDDKENLHTDGDQDLVVNQKAGKLTMRPSSSRSEPVPNIYPGVLCEESKVQNQHQRAMYRRLFMDIEREQVKENIRRQQHKKKIVQLKKKAEGERLQLEEKARSAVELKNPLTGETDLERSESDQVERRNVERKRKEEKAKARKNRETGRFLEALKRNLREKIEDQNREMPPLCSCADTVWDTNPKTCANNCIFYHNPVAYAQALQSLLVSCDMV